MKIVVTHASPDWDAITSVWCIKRFLPGWESAAVQFVPAGQRLKNVAFDNKDLRDPVEHSAEEEVIHVDTGLGPLDHHQTSDMQVCAASRSWEYARIHNTEFRVQNDKTKTRIEALNRIVAVVVSIDHFQEVFWDNPTADYHEFSFLGLLEGIKFQRPNQDTYYMEFGMQCLDAFLHDFENRIWAEKEIREKGKAFQTKFGMGMGFETINDTVIKLAQKMEYVIVIRKDPRKGYVRIKARPNKILPTHTNRTDTINNENRNIDLTPIYEKLQEMDPKATWFLHVSKKMLLNGTPKNPTMVPTTLSLDEIIKIVEKV